MPAPKEQQILFDVSGSATSFSMLAILGASGSGKSTLLNVLSGIHSKKIKVLGNVHVNGAKIDMSVFSAYVEQFDLFVPTLTVKEHLHFHARLRLDPTLSDEQVCARVSELINDFGLNKCKDSQIGSSAGKNSISGGEARRLSIATQVIRRPKIIFLDEPTSGLDSYTAESVIAILKKFSMLGCVIVCTIHQPSSQIFGHFDKLMLLSEGRVVYFGERCIAHSFFARAGLECPANFNPSDFYIEQVAIKIGQEEECRARVNKLIMQRLSDTHVQEASDTSAEGNQNAMKKTLRGAQRQAPLFVQFSQLLKRAWLSNIREPILFRSRIIQIIVIGLIFGLIYLQLEFNLSNLQNLAGLFFGMIAQNTFGSVLGVLYIFPAELEVFRRDNRMNLYGPGPYFLAKTFAELPTFTLIPIVFVLLTYFMIGLNPSASVFCIHLVAFILLTHCGLAYGYIVSALSKNFAMASALSTPLLTPLMIFGGFFVRAVDIPIYFVWISYISWFKYGFDLLLINQLSTTALKCVNTTYFSCPPNVTEIPGIVGITQLGLRSDSIWFNALCIFGITVGFRILGYIILALRTHFLEG